MAVAIATYVQNGVRVQPNSVTNPSLGVEPLSMAIAFREDLEVRHDALVAVAQLLQAPSTLTREPHAVGTDENLFRPRV